MTLRKLFPGIVAVVVLSGSGSLTAQTAAPAPIVAAASVELTDAVNDIQPIVYVQSVGGGPEKEVKYPGFDVVKLIIVSDGATLNFAATLTAPPGQAAYEVLEFYVDADNNTKTGITLPDSPRQLTGLEFYGTLEDCLEHSVFGTTCAGTDTSPIKHTAVVTLEKYGKEWMNTETLLSVPASGTATESKKLPVSGAVVQASVPYAAMGLEPGQTIRLMVREACTAKVRGAAQGFFPDILLTLK